MSVTTIGVHMGHVRYAQAHSDVSKKEVDLHFNLIAWYTVWIFNYGLLYVAGSANNWVLFSLVCLVSENNVFYDWVFNKCLGHAAVQLVDSLCYKPGGHRFDSRWCRWNFSLTFFRMHYGPGVDSASNRNEYKEYFVGGNGVQCVGLTSLPPSCADCLESWESQPPGTLRACPGL